MRTTLLTALTALCFVLYPAAAAADGLPVLGIDVGSEGVTAPGAPERYVTIPNGSSTILAKIDRSGGRVGGTTRLHGTFTIPAVAYDGTAGGLSRDGKRLVLIEPRAAFPRETTTFAVVETRNLRVTRVITLRGDFSFDAVSPRGATLFLVHYTDPTNPNRYTVRGYDLDAGRLLPHPIVDPHERNEAMRGAPITRATSADGRWAYTLYDGAGTTPFVHALDTRDRTARCIDLPMLVGLPQLWDLRFTRSADGKLLSIGNAKVGQVAEISTTDLAARAPSARASSRDLHLLWILASLVAAAVLVALGRRALPGDRGRPVSAGA